MNLSSLCTIALYFILPDMSLFSPSMIILSPSDTFFEQKKPWAWKLNKGLMKDHLGLQKIIGAHWGLSFFSVQKWAGQIFWDFKRLTWLNGAHKG